MGDDLNSIDIRYLEKSERPANVPEIIDQVWECSYMGKAIGFLYSTVYGWTNSHEVRDWASPEEWAHWQSQDASLDGLLDGLHIMHKLPRELELQRIQFFLGDDEEDSDIVDESEIYNFLDPYLQGLSESEQIEVLKDALFRCAMELEISKDYSPDQPSGVDQWMAWFVKLASETLFEYEETEGS